MNAEIKLEQFSGPLDLLLSLLSEQKLSISELALSQITEQYLDYLDKLGENRTEELADFLVIATRLLLLKSKSLLPQFSPEEEEEPSLEDQLKLYKKFLDASKKMNKIWMNDQKSSFRVEPPRMPEGFIPPSNLTLDFIHESMVQLVNRIAPPKPLPKTEIDRTISVKEKIAQIRKLLQRKKITGFFEILENAENKTEVIVGFLALLELLKQGNVGLKQQGVFGDITIEKV